MDNDADRIIEALGTYYARSERRKMWWEIGKIVANVLTTAVLVWLVYRHLGARVEDVATRLDVRAIQTQQDLESLTKSVGDAWRQIDVISGASQ